MGILWKFIVTICAVVLLSTLTIVNAQTLNTTELQPGNDISPSNTSNVDQSATNETEIPTLSVINSTLTTELHNQTQASSETTVIQVESTAVPPSDSTPAPNLTTPSQNGSSNKQASLYLLLAIMPALYIFILNSN